jgi:hypothetical protein
MTYYYNKQTKPSFYLYECVRDAFSSRARSQARKHKFPRRAIRNSALDAFFEHLVDFGYVGEFGSRAEERGRT